MVVLPLPLGPIKTTNPPAFISAKNAYKSGPPAKLVVLTYTECFANVSFATKFKSGMTVDVYKEFITKEVSNIYKAAAPPSIDITAP